MSGAGAGGSRDTSGAGEQLSLPGLEPSPAARRAIAQALAPGGPLGRPYNYRAADGKRATYCLECKTGLPAGYRDRLCKHCRAGSERLELWLAVLEDTGSHTVASHEVFSGRVALSEAEAEYDYLRAGGARR